MSQTFTVFWRRCSFSALQRAEIAEIQPHRPDRRSGVLRFSALQRAEIAEIMSSSGYDSREDLCFSALQRAEIAEMVRRLPDGRAAYRFQCSSTSRNC